jgi:hypothetical protein
MPGLLRAFVTTVAGGPQGSIGRWILRLRCAEQ